MLDGRDGVVGIKHPLAVTEVQWSGRRDVGEGTANGPEYWF